VILILLDKTALDDPSEGPFPEEMRPMQDRFDLAVTAALLEHLTDQASDAVLWAVTTKLTDERRGSYSTTQGGLITRRWVDYQTRPIRELAQEALKRAFGVDHGYDIEKWRNEILGR